MSQITKELNEMKINNTPDKEFKVMAMKILYGLDKRVKDLSKTFNKETYEYKVRDKELDNRNKKYTRGSQ